MFQGMKVSGVHYEHVNTAIHSVPDFFGGHHRSSIFCQHHFSTTHYSQGISKETGIYLSFLYTYKWLYSHSFYSLATCKAQLINPLFYAHLPISGNLLQQYRHTLCRFIEGFFNVKRNGSFRLATCDCLTTLKSTGFSAVSKLIRLSQKSLNARVFNQFIP